MNKERNKKDSTQKSKNKDNIKLVCPLCLKDKKTKTLDDGYVVCAYCGLVIFKQNYSLEKIDAPGFKKIYLNKKKRDDNEKQCQEKSKHHNLITINEFIEQYHHR